MAATSDRNDHSSVLVRFYGKDAALLPRIDKARGDLSRNAWIVGVLGDAVKSPARRPATRPAGTTGRSTTNGTGKAKASKAAAKRDVTPRFKTGRGAK